MSKEIYYKSDFKRYESPRKNPAYTFSGPFRLVYYTTGKTAFVASHCEGAYTNCELLEDGRLKVVFEEHGLEPGQLLCRNEFYLTDEDFKDGICDAPFTTTTDVFLSANGKAISTSAPSGCCGTEIDCSDPVEGSQLLMTFSMEPQGEVHLANCEFEVKYYTSTIERCHTITKTEMTKRSEDVYLALVETDLTGPGTLKYVATITIPNEDAPKGELKIIKDVTTKVNIRPMPK